MSLYYGYLQAVIEIVGKNVQVYKIVIINNRKKPRTHTPFIPKLNVYNRTS